MPKHFRLTMRAAIIEGARGMVAEKGKEILFCLMSFSEVVHRR